MLAQVNAIVNALGVRERLLKVSAARADEVLAVPTFSKENFGTTSRSPFSARCLSRDLVSPYFNLFLCCSRFNALLFIVEE